MKKKSKSPKRKNQNKNKKKQEAPSENQVQETSSNIPQSRPPFQETWRSDSLTETKEVPKQYGLLKKITNLILRIDPKISSGDLIPKGEITSARQKMESELGEKLTNVRSGNSSETLIQTENVPSKTKKNQKNKPSSGPLISKDETLLHVKDLLPQLKDSDLDNVLKSIPSSDSSSLMNKVSTLGYPSYDQFYSALGDEICNFLNDFKSSLNYRISVLRKNGGDDDSAELELMSAPLKIKIFKSSLSKPDFDRVMSLLNGIANKVKLQESKLAEDKAKPDEFAEASMEEKKQTVENPVPPQDTTTPVNVPASEIKNSKPKKKKTQKKSTKKKSKRK
jgi:hypothetical protein